MKKLFIAIALLMAGSTVNAQDFKPAAKSVTTDFGLDGGLGDTDFDLLNSQLRFRYFQKSDIAYRLGVEINKNSNNETVFGNANEVGYRKLANNYTGLNLGIEKHFKGTERLSPYIGADLILGSYKVKNEFKNFYNDDYSSNPLDTFTEDYKPTYTFGVKAFLGADYYIAKHLFLGVEAGLRYESYKAGELKFTNHNGVVTNYSSSYSNSHLNNTMFSRIRIGFVF